MVMLEKMIAVRLDGLKLFDERTKIPLWLPRNCNNIGTIDADHPRKRCHEGCPLLTFPTHYR